MTNTQWRPPADDAPEADLAEQRIAADATDEEAGLDLDRLADIVEIDANPADVIDQAISIPLPADDYEIER